jgi:hypothetical protein
VATSCVRSGAGGKKSKVLLCVKQQMFPKTTCGRVGCYLRAITNSGLGIHEGDKLEPPTPPSPTRLDLGVQPIKPTFIMVGDQVENAVGTDTDVANATDLVLQETLFTGDSTGFQLEPDQ